MGAIWGAVAGLAVSGIGAWQNSQAQDANEAATRQARDDYERRLRFAAEEAKKMWEQYNKVVEQRPGTDWNTFARNYIRALDDPSLREAYTNAKEEDFEKMREFAKAASEQNFDTLMDTFNKLNGGRGREVLDERTRMVLDIDAAERFARARELSLPGRVGASTVRYDSTGRLIEGQRADKNAFNIAYETIVETDRERLNNLTQLENDRLRAAQSQQQKALDFLSFFDATGFASNLEDKRNAMELAFQMSDEERAFQLASAFAQQAAGIQPVQPQLQNNTVGNQLITEGIKMATSAYSDYRTNRNTNTYS
jgi:hypothetical protein